ncbi:hypothetical protein PVAP13_5NG487000 [Panicum virgatum]|uniref:CCHC-type domain-containing protein n=1 Tax=Panicum virgatum TaxID=38727 RepID=A0A8T0S4L9_PANVG|nr:hypothetical protein PVAP13_5NG487000 [Panicum virgatum]
MQSNTLSPHSMKLTKPEIPTGPVKRQVAEAWNRQRNKRSRGTPELERERQHKDIKTPGICQCYGHYGRLCLQEDSLMTAETRQCYHSDINRELSMQDPNLEGVTQAEDRNPAINLEDWTITFKEFQPKRCKRTKKPISKASQEKDLSQLLADNVVQPLCDHSIKKDPDVQAIPPRVVEEQTSSRDGRIKRVMCYKCGEKGHYANRCSTKRESQDGYAKRVCFGCGKEGHYANSCPTKHKKTRSHDLRLYCLKCGEHGHIASWCEKDDDNQLHSQSPNSSALGQT